MRSRSLLFFPSPPFVLGKTLGDRKVELGPPSRRCCGDVLKSALGLDHEVLK